VFVRKGRMWNRCPIIIANIDFSLMAMDRKQKAEDRYLTSENRHRTSVLPLWG